MQQIIASVMIVVFYVTPVIWKPNLIPDGTAHLLLGLNPFYHFLQITRLPLLGQSPTFENWSLAIFAALVASIIAYFAAKKFQSRLAYWV
jgi:lipopolysaccharide transport system permease protein